MPTYGWLLDPKRCIECRACEVACKQWNQLETGVDVRFRRVQPRESGTFPNVRTQALSLACNHCEKANCSLVCPTKSITRRPDGIVVTNPDTCIGCGYCRKFCPYQAPQINASTHKMQKCIMCYDRVDQGLEPACVTLCPTGALQWGPWDEIAAKGAAEHEGFTNPRYTRPHIRFATGPWGEGR